jgi:DNA-nicking Smr family endonuclease
LPNGGLGVQSSSLNVTNPLGGLGFRRMDEPSQLPIDGVLDLHTFQPREVKDLVPDYLAACQERGILQVRIIHGKGIGNLRRTVHAILARHPQVASFTLDHPQYGGWGATLVALRKPVAP